MIRTHLPRRSADSFDTLCRRSVDDRNVIADEDAHVTCGRCNDLERGIDRFVASREVGQYAHKGTRADVEFNERLAEYADDNRNVWEGA